MANLKTTTIDGSLTQRSGVQSGYITNQAALNGDVMFSMLNHGLVQPQPIIFTASTGTNLGGNALLPAAITAGTVYYVKTGWTGGSSYFILTGIANNFHVSATPGGANIDQTSGFQGVVASPGHAWTVPLGAGTSVTVNLSLGNFFEMSMDKVTGSIATFTISNPPASQVSTFKLRITQSSTARDFSWGSLSAFKWPGGITPTLTTTDDAVDIYSFTTWDNGTTWYGKVVGQNFLL